MAFIEANELVKTYRPKGAPALRALDGLDLSVPEGTVAALLGPNGAGKTTTLKTLLRLTFPSEGELSIFGLPPSRRDSMRRVGYMPENPYVYQYLKAPEFLDLCGRLLGMERKHRARRVEEMIDAVGLRHAVDRPVGRFSKGMMQRVGLAQALLHDPELLVLDEPMSGLDPIGRKEIRDLLLAQRAAGKTLIFTSHILSDVEMLCDRVVIMQRGKVHARGLIRDLLRGDDGFDIHFEGGEAALHETLGGLGALSERAGVHLLRLTDRAAMHEALEKVLASDATLMGVTPHTRSLEALFESSDESA